MCPFNEDRIMAWVTSTGSFAGCEDCTYHGVLHHEAQRCLGGQVQGPCHNVHIIAGLCQQVHKALKTRPIVSVEAPPNLEGTAIVTRIKLQIP